MPHVHEQCIDDDFFFSRSLSLFLSTGCPYSCLLFFPIFSRWKGEDVSLTAKWTHRVTRSLKEWTIESETKCTRIVSFIFVSFSSYLIGLLFFLPHLLHRWSAKYLFLSLSFVVLASPSHGTIDSTVALSTLLSLSLTLSFSLYAACEKDITRCTRELLKQVKSHTPLSVCNVNRCDVLCVTHSRLPLTSLSLSLSVTSSTPREYFERSLSWSFVQ